jgi:Cu+-exporting ATPase
MTTEHCVNRVAAALRGVDGVSDVGVRLVPGQVRVVHEASAARPALVRAIEAAGFDVPSDDDESTADARTQSIVDLWTPPSNVARAAPRLAARARLTASTNIARMSLPVVGMHCASCVSAVEAALCRVPGVEAAYVNLASQRATATVAEDVTLEALRHAIDEAGYESPVARPGESSLDMEARARADDVAFLQRRLVVSAPLTLAVVLLAMSHVDGRTSGVLQLLASTPVLLYGGSRYLRGLFASLRSRVADMNTLIGLGTGVAFLWSAAVVVAPGLMASVGGQGALPLYFESAVAIVTLVLFGSLLEARARGKASQAMRQLMSLAPRRARIVREGGPELEVDVSDVVLGDVLTVRPGEQIPTDGVVRAGWSAADQSLVTGESLPVALEPGSGVFGGTVNLTGALRVEATRTGADSAIGRILQVVQDAQGSRAPLQRMADRVAAVFVPVVLVTAAATFGVWYALASADPVPTALVHTVAVLIIACPCALGIATPTAILVGVARGAQQGILLRDAASLETAHALRVIVLDKTGTLTEGRPSVADIDILPGESRDEVVRVAAAAERDSEHPVGRAVVAAAADLEVPEASDLEVRPGLGIVATVGRWRVYVGSARAMAEHGIALGPLATAVEDHASRGRTVVCAGWDGRVRGVFAVSDRMRPSSPGVVRRLRAQGLDVVMLTGDSRVAAEAIAREAGISHVIAEALPDEKAARIRELQQGGRKVGMVGDGINDAPALAQADVGFAQRPGTDSAMEAAGITLLRSDLRGVDDPNALSQNLFFAFVYNACGIPLAAGVLAPIGIELSPMVAAGAMAMSSVSVLTNSLRLTRFRSVEARSRASSFA